MRNSLVLDWYGDKVLFGNICRLCDSRLDVCALRNTDTDLALFVTDDDECLETEAATALDDTRDTVDVDDDLFEFFRLLRHVPAIVAARWASALASLSLRSLFCHD